MKLELDTGTCEYVIRSYGPGVIVVSDERLSCSCVISANQIIRQWRPASFLDLRPEDFSSIVELNPEVVLLGTGERLRFPDPDIIAPLREKNIGFEAMDTGAACRSYTVLAAEGRAVAVALLMIEPTHGNHSR